MHWANSNPLFERYFALRVTIEPTWKDGKSIWSTCINNGISLSFLLSEERRRRYLIEMRFVSVVRSQAISQWKPLKMPGRELNNWTKWSWEAWRTDVSKKTRCIGRDGNMKLNVTARTLSIQEGDKARLWGSYVSSWPPSTDHLAGCFHHTPIRHRIDAAPVNELSFSAPDPT